MRDNDLSGPNIWPGDVLMIYTSRPLLGVRTFDEIPTRETIEMPLETIYMQSTDFSETIPRMLLNIRN
jgi:hypothetical protein